MNVWLEEDGDYMRLPLKWRAARRIMICWCGFLAAMIVVLYGFVLINVRRSGFEAAQGFQIDVDDENGDQVLYRCEVVIG